MFLRIATWITGDDYSTVKRYDVNSRKKIVNTALQMLIPISIWVFVGFGLVTALLDKGIVAGAITGLVLGLFVFIVDRTIIQGFSNWAGTASRILFTVLSGALGAVVFDSIIFKDDVDKIITGQQQVSVDSMAMAMAMNSEVYANMQTQKAQANQKYQEYLAAEKAFLAEIDGVGGSGNSGYGDIAKQKEAVMNQKKAEWQEANNSNLEAVNNFNATVSNNRVTIQENDGSNAFFYRFKVLKDFVLNDSWAIALWLVFFGCTLLLESFVVLSKLTSKKTCYEKDLEVYEQLKDRQRGGEAIKTASAA